MPTIAPGVDFDTVAREWRCKWNEADDKKSLVEVQKVLNEVMPKVSSIKGVKHVQRIVCGGCFDYKVMISLPADKFGDWEKEGFEPEAEFLEAVKKIPGVVTVETQTMTSMPVKIAPPVKLKKAKFKKISSLNPESSGFSLEGKVMGASKEVEGKGSAVFYEVSIGDASGKCTLSLRADQKDVCTLNGVVVARNARVQMIKGYIRVVIDKWGKLEKSEEKVDDVGEKDVSSTEFELARA